MKFSIIIPAYKATFLGECIDSLLAQIYSDFEIIIVNDDSPEDIESIINFYSDKRIRYFRNEKNFGAENVVKNWNCGLEYVTGDYVICMGDDDKLCPNCLQDYSNLISEHPECDVYYSRTQIIDENSRITRTLGARPERESVYEMIWNRWNGRTMFIGDYLYKTDTLRKNGGFYFLPFAWGSDAISAYIAGQSNGIANTQNVGFMYRVNGKTISRNFNNIEGKVAALNLERSWFKKFFKIVPDNTKDNDIRINLINETKRHFNKMYADDIVYGISKKPLSQAKYWLAHAKENGLSHQFIFKCILRGWLS